MPSILCAGKNDGLLTLRSSVLRATGVPVLESHSIADVRALLRAAVVDVAVLCHTFTEEEAREIAAAVKSANLKSGVCLLYQKTIPTATPLFDLRVDVADGPEVLLQAVTLLLHH
jgi:hypothetical protein